EFLLTPRGGAAFLRGGIIWRISMEVLGDGALEEAITRSQEGPSSDARDASAAIVLSRSGDEYHDDMLTPEEEEFVCGTYLVYVENFDTSSKLSWWPSPTTWETSGLNFGHWTPFCESWFKSHLEKIRSGTNKPKNATTWRSNIKLEKAKVRKLSLRVAEANEAYLLNDVGIETL
ncbi:uncharacterized protein BXZ73DRAFT_43444, partial [Epithele typhae]|uniref:uncharacterized protein n=1 Tax=Epithele typhae TaxID=378194 RepID=UPI002007EB82